MEHIKKCPACNTYTFKDTCCSQKTASAKPPRYSPEDPYKKWRQKARS